MTDDALVPSAQQDFQSAYKNARFYSTDGTPVPSNEGVWWRGRISEISGIVIGILGVSE